MVTATRCKLRLTRAISVPCFSWPSQTIKVFGPFLAAFALPKTSFANAAVLSIRELADIQERHGVVAKAIGKRRQKREAAFLLIEALNVAARLRAEDDAAVTPLRRTNRALACPPGPLLPPRLATAAGDFVALIESKRYRHVDLQTRDGRRGK